MLFDAAAALVLAWLVGYAANDLLRRLEMDRVLVERNERHTKISITTEVPRARRSGVLITVFVETLAIVMFTVLTLGAAIEPQRTSELNGAVYWIAFAIEIVVIARATTRAYRTIKAAR